MPSEGTTNKPNLRITRVFREELLKALGVTADKDVENEGNFKSALLDALGVDHIPQDIANFEKWREKLIEAADNISEGGGGGGGGDSDFSTAEVIIQTGDSNMDASELTAIAVEDDYIFEAGMDGNSPMSFMLVLYKGHQYISADSDTVKSISGNVTFDDENGLDIAGDCTIVLNYMQII